MEYPLISIIVPIYNTEKYLNQCIESIVNQSYKNLQIILIDDGSTDKSNQICKLWEKRDNRINLVEQNNLGAAGAKNTGLNLIEGEWFLIVDSDDILLNHTVELLYNCANDNMADIVEGKLMPFYDSTFKMVMEKEKIPLNVRSFNEEQAIYELIIERKFHQTPCNKIYKSNLIENIRFPQGRYIDDEYWTYKVFANAKKIISIDNIIYYYRKHENSAMGRAYSLGRLDSLDAFMERVDFVKDKYPSLETIAIEKFLINSIFNFQKLCFFSKLDLMKDNRGKILKNYKIYYKTYKNYNSICFKEKILFEIFYRCPYLICNIRNVLRRGM